MVGPNILWYCTDQQRFDTIAGLGFGHARTPRLDALMERGVAFSHAFCQAPICTPSRASFLTGMYPSAIPANQNGNPAFPAAAAERLVPRRLRDAGYDCGLVGKLHLASAAGGKEPRVDDGYRFVRYSTSPHGRLPGQDYAAWLRQRGVDADAVMARVPHTAVDRHVANGVVWERVCPPTADDDNIPAELHQTRWCTEMALEFIDQRRSCDTPWLLSINPFDPHPPFDPPWEYYRRQEPESLPLPHYDTGDDTGDLAHQQRLHAAGIDFQSRATREDHAHARRRSACYFAMIEQLDHEFGRLLEHLSAVGQLDDTLVIFTSDHGEMLGDHGMVLKGCRFYEGAVRVPLIVSGPGVEQPGRVCGDLVELSDLAPTIYEAAGLEVPWWVQGRALTPQLQGRPDAGRAYVRAEYRGALAFPDPTHATMYRTRTHKLVTYHGKGIQELFDLEADPWEHHDLSRLPQHRDLLRDLSQESYDATVAAAPPEPARIAGH